MLIKKYISPAMDVLERLDAEGLLCSSFEDNNGTEFLIEEGEIEI